jgi:excisionase family DNA binding protein
VETVLRPLVDIAEVARLLGVSKITVRRKVNSRELPCIRLTKGGPLRFDLRDIEKFVERHKE